MKRILTAFMAMALILTASAAFAANPQTVTVTIAEVNALTIAGSPSLTVNAAVAGSDPTPATDSSSSYTITTNGSGKKIQAHNDSAMPANTTLSANRAAVAPGTSSGTVVLTTTDQALETGLANTKGTGSITYTLSATIAATPFSGTRLVTFTITN